MSPIIRNSLFVCILCLIWTNITIISGNTMSAQNNLLLDLTFELVITIYISHSVSLLMRTLHAAYVRVVGGIGDEALSHMMVACLVGILLTGFGTYAGFAANHWHTFVICFTIGFFSTLFTYLHIFSLQSRKPISP